jgi:5-methyltetrahydropteroyltriglutamate--homocysteine methyltransferase
MLGLPLLAATMVGSYAVPDWLMDRDALRGRLPPRVRAREIWRVAEPYLAQAQDDATLLAIREQERAGLDLIGDGEMRRESYSNAFANSLGGIAHDNPGTAMDRTGKPTSVPRVVGPIEHRASTLVDEVRFLRANTDRRTKITLPGPFTMAQQAQNDFYPDVRRLALAYADAVNQEIRLLHAAGADVVQLDEPYLQARPELAQQFGVEAVNRAVHGVAGVTALHICFGYAHVHNYAAKPSGYSFLPELEACEVGIVSIEAAQPQVDPAVLRRLPSKTIMLGVISLGDLAIETPATVAARIEAALEHAPAERLMVAPDCGLKYLDRDVAFGKLRAMVQGTAIARSRLN